MFENVAFALEVIGRPRHVVANQVPQVLDLVGLANKRDNLPGELSGGEQQRVAVARAFVNRPLILLADEPTGNLDPQTSQGIMQLLDRINRTGTTVVVATHDEVLVDKMRRRVHRARATASWSATRPAASTASTVVGAAAVDVAAAGWADAGLCRLRRPRDGIQPVAQPPDDGRRHPHRGRVPVAGRRRAAAAPGLGQRHRALERGTKVTVWMEPERQQAGDRRRQDRAVAAQLRGPAVPVLEQGTELRRGPPAAALGRLPGHHRERDAHLLLVRPGRPLRRGPGGPHLQRDGRGLLR